MPITDLSQTVQLKRLVISGSAAPKEGTQSLVLHDTQTDLVWCLVEFLDEKEQVIAALTKSITSDPQPDTRLQQHLAVRNWHLPSLAEARDLLSHYEPAASDCYLIRYLNTPLVCRDPDQLGPCTLVQRSRARTPRPGPSAGGISPRNSMS